MTAISVRNLDPDVKAKLRVRAAEHGRSMEAEIRAILVEQYPNCRDLSVCSMRSEQSASNTVAWIWSFLIASDGNGRSTSRDHSRYKCH